MDKATSVLAALQAGKLPTTEQINGFIDYLLESDLIQVDSIAGQPQLTAQGKKLAGDVRELLAANKEIGSTKNSDNVLQEAFWHLSQADLAQTSVGAKGNSADAKKIGGSIRKALEVVWGNLNNEGTSVFADFASFSRLTLADAAEIVEQNAAAAKDSLRQTEEEVQAGERTATGATKRPAEGEPEDADARVKFEKTMDQVKVAGSKVIGAGQSAKAGIERNAQRTSDRLREAYYKVADRAQKDPEYRDAISTIFDLVEKWLNKTLDTAADVNKNTTVDTFIDDPTPEQHIPTALSNIRILAERLSGDKSLDDLFAHVRSCAADIRSDPDTKTWFDEFFAHARKTLEEPGYGRSEEAEKKGDFLRRRWNELLDADSDKGRKWKVDVQALQKELEEFQDRAANEPTLNRVRAAHEQLGKDLSEAFGTGAQLGAQAAMSQGTWVWQDFINVYLGRMFTLFKGYPIPRTEFKDAETEFVLEDLSLEKLSLLPGNLYIRNITDIDISATESGETDTAIGAMTHVHAKGVQLDLREVSFYYKDKTATVGPAEFTGILELKMPPQGIDVDLKIRLLPNTEKGLRERERIKGFNKIEHVEVNISDEVELNIKDSNHSILTSLFKPVMLAGFRRVLAQTLSEQLTTSLAFIDGVAWDISNRAVVFEDTGLPRGASLMAAAWSEIGRFSRGQSSRAGVTEGWRVTGTGIIKQDGQGGVFAMGAEPQVLSGEKHGPKERLAEPLADKAQRAADELGVSDVNMGDATGAAQDVAGKAQAIMQEGVKQVKGFKATIDAKRERELHTEGWKSSAFSV